MEAFVITLREGVEAALVVALILGYLSQTGRARLNRHVYIGLIAAVVASLVGAFGFTRLGLDPENEMLEGALLGVAAVLVATLVFWMWRASRYIRRHVEQRLDSMIGTGSRRQGWGLASFTFFMVFREGVETVLLLAAFSLTASSGVLNLIGGAAGLGLALLFGVVFARGSTRINLRLFFGVTSIVLMILALRLLAGSVHEFSEVGLLPSTPAELAVVGFIVRDSTSIIILLVLLLIPLVAVLPSMRRGAQDVAAPAGESPARRRKRLAAQRGTRRWRLAVVGVTLAIVAPLGLAAYSSAAAGYRPEPQAVTPEGEMIRVPAETLESGRLYKFVYNNGRVDIRFFVIKRADGSLAVALDACAICPPAGYYQVGDQVICDNCNAPINLATIGMGGGCNPIPLAGSLEGDMLTIAVADLEAGQSVFAV